MMELGWLRHIAPSQVPQEKSLNKKRQFLFLNKSLIALCKWRPDWYVQFQLRTEQLVNNQLNNKLTSKITTDGKMNQLGTVYATKRRRRNGKRYSKVLICFLYTLNQSCRNKSVESNDAIFAICYRPLMMSIIDQLIQLLNRWTSIKISNERAEDQDEDEEEVSISKER